MSRRPSWRWSASGTVTGALCGCNPYQIAVTARLFVAHVGAAVLAGESKFGVHRTHQYDVHGRRLWDPPGGGRPSNFDEAAAARLKARLELFLLERKAATGRLPYREDEKVLLFVRDLVEAEGLKSSDDILRKQIIAPALRKLKSTTVENKIDRN
jgi:hypothetical protein